MAEWDAPIRSVRPEPFSGQALVERLRLTGLSLGYALMMAPALTMAILTLLSIPLGLAFGVGIGIALGAVPATQAVAGVHRRVSGMLLGEAIPEAYVDLSALPVLSRPFRWISEKARWRDFAFCCFSATGGFVLSVLPAGLLTVPLTWLILGLAGATWAAWLLVLVTGPLLVVWWVATPGLVRARALADRGILGQGQVAALAARVETVESTRAETLDHSAAELRRIERDLHDGAQARIAAVGMSVGLAEKLMASDPDAAAALLREARETTVSALEDLRGVVRGILPPVLADRGLVGAVQAITAGLPLPVTVAIELPGRLPDPVESAAYFAVAECLANAVKHSGADRAFVRGSHNGQRLRIVVGDNGCGGADGTGHGLSGVATRLAAFDGSVEVESPPGGPTLIALEVPCRI
ncbi:histidine kinase [Nocardioides sp. NPDC006273]|uniref:sensor histidine kinase n=1 Tax=Nocardioides sp. NPDC006273 TaxID=3155598 RepID=UPI0033A234C9